MDETGNPVPAMKEDWQTKPMPRRGKHFTLKRTLSAEETEALRLGHIPQEMEDKWFWYTEGDTLYAHRSWSGICIYRMELKPNGRHRVTVNRDPKEYDCGSVRQEKERLNRLLDWFGQMNYDYYGEWIDETVRMPGKR